MRWIIVICSWGLFSASDPIVNPSGKVVFGVRIAMGVNSQMTSFIACRFGTEGYVREKRIFSRDEFIKIVSGHWPSNFNPKRINYFEQEGVAGGMFNNDTIRQYIPYCPAFDSLWKINFSTYPLRGGTENGWSLGLYKPSLKQEKFISERYNIGHLDIDFIIDTNFWNLLRDVEDPNWVANYRVLQ